MLGFEEGGDVMISKVPHDRGAEKLVLKVMVPNPQSCWVAEPILELKTPNSFL